MVSTNFPVAQLYSLCYSTSSMMGTAFRFLITSLVTLCSLVNTFGAVLSFLLDSFLVLIGGYFLLSGDFFLIGEPYFLGITKLLLESPRFSLSTGSGDEIFTGLVCSLELDLFLVLTSNELKKSFDVSSSFLCLI